MGRDGIPVRPLACIRAAETTKGRLPFPFSEDMVRVSGAYRTELAKVPRQRSSEGGGGGGRKITTIRRRNKQRVI